jgi:GT2 family glycosyltransferase
LRSLRGQSLPREEFEVLVVDDGSNDGTREFLARQSDVRTVRQQWRGLAAARAVGLRASRGDIVAFIDDDAEADPHWLELLVSAIQRDGVGMVGGRVRTAPKRELLARIGPTGEVEWSGFDAVTKGEVAVDFVPGGSMAVWRHLVDQAGGFDLEYTKSAWREETDLCVRIMRLGHRILYVPDASIDHVSARWKGGAGSRFGFQYSLARNDGYFVSKLFPSPRAALRTILAAPLRAAVPDLLRAAFALALVPVRIVAGIAGYVKGARARSSS